MSTAAKMLEELKVEASDWNIGRMEKALENKEHTSFILEERRVAMCERAYLYVTVFADENNLPKGNWGTYHISERMDHEILGKVVWSSMLIDSSG